MVAKQNGWTCVILDILLIFVFHFMVLVVIWLEWVVYCFYLGLYFVTL